MTSVSTGQQIDEPNNNVSGYLVIEVVNLSLMAAEIN
jgi:hypothetical protein